MDFPTIWTGNHLQSDLVATTNNHLELLIVQNEKLIKAIDNLEQTTVYLNEENGRLQSKVFWLTRVGTGLAVLQLVQVFDIVNRWISG